MAVVADPVAQVGRHAVCTDGLADGHDDGGEDGGQDQRQRDVAQDLRLAGTLDLTHLLQLGVDGTQRAGHHDIGKRVVMHGHAQDNGDGAISQPVRDREAQAGQESVCSAGGVAEHRQPAECLGPGGDHIGDDDQHAEDLFPRDIRANHQPGQNGTQRDGDDDHEHADDQGVPQRLPQNSLGHVAGQHVLPVVQGEIAHLGAIADAAQLRLPRGKGRGDHSQQGNDDQAEQNNQADQDDHIEGVLYHIQYQVLQPPLRQRFLGEGLL